MWKRLWSEHFCLSHDGFCCKSLSSLWGGSGRWISGKLSGAFNFLCQIWSCYCVFKLLIGYIVVLSIFFFFKTQLNQEVAIPISMEYRDMEIKQWFNFCPLMSALMTTFRTEGSWFHRQVTSEVRFWAPHVQGQALTSFSSSSYVRWESCFCS